MKPGKKWWTVLVVSLALFWVTASLVALSGAVYRPAPFIRSHYLIPPRPIYDPNLAKLINEELRDSWQKPERVLDAIGDIQGLTIADIGAGTGYFTIPVLKASGPDGFVFATDIQPEVLEILAEKIPDEHKQRIALITSSSNSTGVPKKVDLILLIQVLGEVEQQRAFLGQLKEIMHEQSRLVLIDSKHVTDPSSGFTRPINLHHLLAGLREEGLQLVPEYDAQAFDFLPKQFFLILELKK